MNLYTYVFNNPNSLIDQLGLCAVKAGVDWTKNKIKQGWDWWSDVATTTWDFWSDPQLYRDAVNKFDEFIMALPVDSVGINAGGGMTGGLFYQSGPKGALATAVIFDAENISIISTNDLGGGATNGKFSGGLFVNAVVGINGAQGHDYAGDALSVSGTVGPVSMAYTDPITDKGDKAFLEAGFAPFKRGGQAEIGITKSKGEGFTFKNPLADEGKWWGEFFYDLLH